jgi:6-phosphogluconolactonase (cycloisomerase 2 family)
MRSKLLSFFFLAVLSCLVISCLAGCGSGSLTASTQPTPTVSPAPSPLPSPTATPLPSPIPSPTPPITPSHFIYGITVFESSSGYEAGVINNGTVSPLANDFNNAGLGENIVTQLIADPAGRFLYALNVGASSFGNTLGPPGIAEMQINSLTGALTRVPGGPLIFTSATVHDGMLAIDMSGQFLYQPSAGFFDIYAINQNTGLLTQVSTSTIPSLGFFTVISPDGHFLFNAGNQTVEALSIGSGGSLTLVQSPILTGGTAMGLAGQLAVSSDNRFLFVLNQGSIGIFNIGATGTLNPVIGSPFLTDPGAAGFSLAPDGRHLYVAFQANNVNSVKGFTFDPVTSTLSGIPGAAITDNAMTVTVDASGKFAYISEAGQLVTYSIDPSTGALTRFSQAAKPISEGPQSMVVVP